MKMNNVKESIQTASVFEQTKKYAGGWVLVLSRGPAAVRLPIGVDMNGPGRELISFLTARRYGVLPNASKWIIYYNHNKIIAQPPVSMRLTALLLQSSAAGYLSTQIPPLVGRKEA